MAEYKSRSITDEYGNRVSLRPDGTVSWNIGGGGGVTKAKGLAERAKYGAVGADTPEAEFERLAARMGRATEKGIKPSGLWSSRSTAPTAPTPAPTPAPAPSYGGGFSGGGMGGLMGQIADAYSQPLDFSSLPGLSGVSGPSQSVDFTDAFDPRFQNVNFLDPFDSRLQGVSFGGGTQGVDFSGGGPSVATLDWNEPSGNPGGPGGGKGGQAMAPPPMMQQPPMQQAPPMQGGGKGAGKGGAAAQPQPFGRLYG